MDREMFESKLDYHLFLYEQLTSQMAVIQKTARQNEIASFETMMENETLRDVLLLKFILFQRTIKKAGVSTLENRYKMNLKPFPWLGAEYFDQNCTLHYDCVWSLLRDLKPLKRQIEKIKKYDENSRTVCGEDIRCSFCGKSQQDVERMIVGQHEAICSECVEICTKALRETAEEP